MPEEQNNVGERANNRINALLSAFGWDERGTSNVDISCEKREHNQDDHGIDGYFTYDDPYISSRHAGRGVLVESKSKKGEYWNGTEMNDAVTQARQALECSVLSDDFKSQFEDNPDRIVNASIVSAWANDGEYDSEKFQGYIDGCDIKPLASGPYYVLILDNENLDRLASLHSQHSSIGSRYATSKENIMKREFGFYYPPLQVQKSEPKIENSISFEYLFSDYVYSKLEYIKWLDNEERAEDKEIGIIYNFGGRSYEDMEFLYISARENGLLNADEIWIYSYTEGTEEGETEHESVVSELKENELPESTDFKFNTLARTDYQTYMEQMIGDNDD